MTVKRRTSEKTLKSGIGPHGSFESATAFGRSEERQASALSPRITGIP